MNAYVVANKEQEKCILKALSDKGNRWFDKTPLMNWVPSEHFLTGEHFPYIFYENSAGTVKVNPYKSGVPDCERVAYNGLKESESKIKISKDIYDALVEWRKEYTNVIEIGEVSLINPHEVNYLDTIVGDWWLDSTVSNAESNNRLIAIVKWANGEDIFKVVPNKKWVVRSKETDINDEYHYSILAKFSDTIESNYYFTYDINSATSFDTKEEAESWANAHQEVVEVEV